MSSAAKWDAIYAQQYCSGSASDVLSENLHLLPTSGIALDLACGLGGNAIQLARHGLSVHAWDVSQIALDKINQYSHKHGLNINTTQRDVESCPPDTNAFDIVTISNFLYRPIFKSIISSLKVNGLLFYQTFTAEKATLAGPTNPDYLLNRGELLSVCKDMDILVYREESLQGDLATGWRNQAMIVARNAVNKSE